MQSPNTIQFPEDPEGLAREPRCLGCGYRLCGIDHASCPECGQRFNAHDPRTYTWRRPFVWHQYWWPGALLAVGIGFLWCVHFYSGHNLGWGLFVGVPLMVGALIGYRPAAQPPFFKFFIKLIAIVSVPVLVLMLMAGGFAGVFCGLILVVIFTPLLLVGLYLGVFLAYAFASILKQFNFRQREYLPILLVVTIPGALHLAERAFAPPIPVQTTTTYQVLAMDRMRAWDAWVFFEEVDHDPPWILKLGLPNPSHVEGRIQAVGDKEICVYTGDARLVKRATEVTPGERLAFEVIEQRNFENHSIRLIDGSFTFDAVDENRTRVMWQPIEHTVARSLHRHVLRGMVEPVGETRLAQRIRRPQP